MWKDCETNIDLLDFDYLVDVVEKIAKDKALSPSTIGIYGDWGSGKSSLMNMVYDRLSYEDKKSNILCIKFNGWLFEGYEDAKTALLGTILDEIEKKKRLPVKAKEHIKNLFKSLDYFKLASKGIKYGMDFLLTGGIGTIAGLSVEAITNAIKTKSHDITEDEIKDALEFTLKKENIRESLKTFQTEFLKLLSAAKIEHLVIFIDELDRCSHDTILESLEAIRLFVFAEGTTFIIGADERQIQYAVKRKYPDIEGNRIDISKEYLEKLIQYPFRIPQLGRKEVQQYITCLLLERELEQNDFYKIRQIIIEEKKTNFIDFDLSFELIKTNNPDLAEKAKDSLLLSKQISSVLAKELNGNPRHCKRFLNALSLRISMAESKAIGLDKRIFAKLMLLEYFKDIVYRAIANNQDVAQKELVLLEKGESVELEVLKHWDDDDWLKEWVSIQPPLGSVDLKPYFYFSRESLKNTLLSTQVTLSSLAEEVLVLLLEESDSAKNAAIEKSKQLSEAEISVIRKNLFERIQSSSEISDPLFGAYIELCADKPFTHNDVLSEIDSLPISSIKPSMVPRFGAFIKVISNKGQGVEILKKWQSTKKLSTAVGFEIDAISIKTK